MQHEKILKESLQGRERQRAYLPNLCTTSKHRCPTCRPTRKPPTATHWGRWGSLGNALEESGMLTAGCLPTRGDQFCTHGGGSEEMANIKRQRHRCNCNVCNSTSIPSSEVPREATVSMLYGSQISRSLVRRKKYCSASFVYSSFLV